MKRFHQYQTDVNSFINNTVENVAWLQMIIKMHPAYTKVHPSLWLNALRPTVICTPPYS